MGCINCAKSLLKTLQDGSQRLVCDNDIDGTGVNSFHICDNYIEKCEKCVHTDVLGYDFPCFLCSSFDYKPYYKKESAENV